MNQQTTLFSNEKLMAMIIPLFLEQLLIMLVGMADTLVVSYAGEVAVSGVSLVNQFNTIFIYLFTALASGPGGACGVRFSRFAVSSTCRSRSTPC